MRIGRSRFVVALLVVACAPLSACNGLTGAGDLEIDDSLGSGDGSSGDSSLSGDSTGAPTGPGSTGAGGATSSGPSSTGAGAGGPSSSGTGTMADPLVDAAGVSITQIAIYQGVKRPLMDGGSQASSNIPVVANRDALVRVFYSTTSGYSGGPVTGLLFLGDGPPIEVQKTLGNGSNDGSLDSTLNFDVPGAMLASGVSYHVEIKQDPSVSAGNNPGANYPASGSESIPAQSSGSTLKIQLVPISYGADGSNRLPDTSAAQLQKYESGFFAEYPVPKIEISVHAAVQWNNGVSAGGNGWDSLLDAIANLKQDDNPPDDVYYYGIFAPASSMGNYCGGGCVAGLGMIGGPGDSYSRAAIGLGFTGQGSVETGVHEIGHTHGRQHTPCGGAAGTDPNYPHAGAAIGVWGYDLVNHDLYEPNDTADFMSYCNPAWVSDYTFGALFNRIKTVNGASIIYPADQMDQAYERVRVDGQGNLTWLSSQTRHKPPLAEPRAVTIQSDDGSETLTGQYYPYDHLEGGVLVWKKPQNPGTSIQVDLAGKISTLSR